jgi:hypothetical protein
MPEFQLSDPRLAAILSGREPWPDEQEIHMSEKPKERPAVIEPQTTRAPDAPGVLGSGQRAGQQPADGSETLSDGRVIATSSAAATADTPGEMYTPKEDVTETDANGSVFLVAAANVPIPLAEARRLGLVKDTQRKAGPQETKD